MTQETLKMALEALETELSIDWTNNDEFNASAEKMHEAIAAIKEALAKEKTLQALHSENERLGLYKDAYAQPEQEPVATVKSETGADITMSWWHEPALPIGTKLYTTPPQRTWVGLTEQERNDIEDYCEMIIGKPAFDAIEAKLKQKNGFAEEKNT